MRRAYSRLLYGGLLVGRVLFSVLPSYIHPDEFFQSSEIAASDILRVTGHRTWEFSPAAPVRSIVPIYMYAGVPMFVLSFFSSLTPWTLFCASRAFMALLSFAVDACVFCTIGSQRTMLLLASSYCLVVFHVHSFSNAFASVVLAVCFWMLAEVERGRRGRRGWLGVLGAGLALGSFTHIAFPMFAWPLGLACLATLASARRAGSLTAWGLVSSVACLAGGGVLAALGMVLADSLYYGSLHWRGRLVSGSLTFTVLNNLSYNSRHENLATHGIQPRYMHVLVNMPLLFGPLYILAVARLWAFLRSGRRAACVGMAAAGSVVSGLALLSAAPHQEARFLLPALPGLAISTWRQVHLAPRSFWYAWIIFNAALFVVFGAMHQAGVVPVVAYLGESVWPHAQCRAVGADALCWEAGSGDVELTTKVFLVSTYLAPRHLLAQPSGLTTGARVEMTDLVGLETEEIRDILARSVRINATLVPKEGELVFKQTAATRYERTLLVMPGSVDVERIAPLDHRLVFSYAPHVNFDHMAETLTRSHRERNKQRAQRRRERETSAERAQRREIERRRAAARRHNETPEEREIRRLNGRMRAMRRRENETEDERLRRRELNRIRMAERRRCLKTAPGADDPPDYADIQSSDLTSADVRRESDPRALGFRVSANSGNSFAPPPPTEDAMSRAFSSLNMSQSDMAMLFHPGRLMNISQPASVFPPLPFADPLTFHLPAASSNASIVQHQLRHPRPHVRPVLGEVNPRQSLAHPQQLLATVSTYPILSGLAPLPGPAPQPRAEPTTTQTIEPQQPPSSNATSYFYYLP
ncbi:alpha 1,2 mannosyltransferase [Coemansia aciculifera]|uniref:Mannosyltransferase n=1 Tax=Coemansia aciculifera TaxID=417176 RepID=A0A9W8IPI2_9FUNG|nr:alpha 1,2 mannosyltransferase [Coemansia aciculifera]